MANFHSNDAKLLKLIARRERIVTPIWIVSLVGVTLLVAQTFATSFSSATDRAAMVTTMQNPAMIAMLGPIYGTDNYTMGAMFNNMMLLFTILTIGFMNIYFVDRHLRRDEERGRIEVIRSLPVSRLASLRVVMEAAVWINLIIALLIGFGLWVLRIDSMTLQGSLLYGVAVGVSGLFFAAVAALFSQLCQSSRSVIAYSMGFMMLLYFLRGIGDLRSETLSRIIPLGLILRTQAYTANVWWPVFVVLAITVGITALAFYFDSIRDMGQGFIPSRPGRKTASPLLKGSIGLAWRLVRMPFVIWLFSSFALGVSYGSVMGDIENFIKGNAMLSQAVGSAPGQSPVDMFIYLLIIIMAIVSTIPVLTVMGKVASEEKHGRLEQVIIGSVPRLKELGSYFLLAFVTSGIMMFVSVSGLYIASSAVMTTPIAYTSLLKSMIIYAPAIWVLLGLMVCVIGWFPRLTTIAWGYLGFSLFVVYIGRLMNLPKWVQDLAPYSHIPQLPMDTINWPTILVLIGIAVVLTIAGFIGYQKRDLM